MDKDLMAIIERDEKISQIKTDIYNFKVKYPELFRGETNRSSLQVNKKTVVDKLRSLIKKQFRLAFQPFI